MAGSVHNYVLLRAVDGDGPKFLIQRVPEAKATKNRMHVDLAVADVDAVVARLTALGATPRRATPYARTTAGGS